MSTIPTMTRLDEIIWQAVDLYANERKWSKSQAIAEIVTNSKELVGYVSNLQKKNKDAA